VSTVLDRAGIQMADLDWRPYRTSFALPWAIALGAAACRGLPCPGMGSGAGTVEEYLGSLGPERREVISAVWDVINQAPPDGFVEGIASGMIGWSLPLERFPDTYNGQPLVGGHGRQARHGLELRAIPEAGRPRSRLGLRGGGQHISGRIHQTVHADALLAPLRGRRLRPSWQEVSAIANKGRRPWTSASAIGIRR